MQRETRLLAPASVFRSSRSVGWNTRLGLVIAGGVLLGVVFVLSLIFDEFFARAGITPASILLCAVLAGFAATCGNDLLHPARILAAILFIGFVVGPIVHAMSGVYALPDGSERQRAELERATWMLLAGATLAMLAMRAALGDGWRRDLRSGSRKPVSRRTGSVAIGVAAAGFALLAAYLILIGPGSISLEGRGATYAVIPQEGRKAYLSLIHPIGVGGLLVIAARALERGSHLTLLLAGLATGVVGVLMALPGSRANLLYAIAPLFFLYVAYRGLPRMRWLIAAASALIVALSYGASLRTADTRSALVRDPLQTLSEHGPKPDSLERLFVVDVAHTEPLLGAIDAFPSTRPFLGGESAAIGFTGPAGWKFGRLIGLRFDPPVGVTLTAVAYGRDPSTFSSGLTATLPGELYANAGVPGVLFGLAAFGAIAGWVRRYAVFSQSAGVLPLYAAAITVLFAIFADYFGQFYRGGAVAIGVALALIASGEKSIALARAAVTVCLIAASSAGLLIARRFIGAPPTDLMTNFAPVYLTLAGLSVFFAVRTAPSYLWRRKFLK